MQAAGVAPTAIDDVLLVGGTTRIPAVQQAVAQLFGRRPSKRINPDEAVAIGAALLADEIGSGTAPTLLDILPMSVGRGTAHRKFDAIVPRHTRLPVTRELMVDADVLGTVHLAQAAIDFGVPRFVFISTGGALLGEPQAYGLLAPRASIPACPAFRRAARLL